MPETTTNHAERRRNGRTRLQMQLQGIRLEPDGGDVMDTLQMVDISRTGLGVVSDRGYYPGQRMVICVPQAGKNASRSLYATIVRCQQLNNQYRVGMEFDAASLGSWCGVSGHVVAAA